jgi:tRNA 2-thiouridine synthesizing protein A
MLCAQGILRLMRALLPLPGGSVVKVLSTDRAAEEDYPAWCRNTGHGFLGHATADDPRWGSLIVSYIRKKTA